MTWTPDQHPEQRMESPGSINSGSAMETKGKNACEALARTLSTGQGKSDCPEISRQPGTAAPVRDQSVRRYEQLARAAKAFIFTVIVKDGHAVCTIHYPGVLQVTGYTEEEYAAQPLLWCSMICAEDKEIVLRQISRLLRGETPPPIRHRIKHKNGSIRWLRNTSVPVLSPQGKLIAYDGLVVDISELEFAKTEQEHQIAELTSALAMVKTLHSLLPICCSCKKIRDDEGYWQQIEAYIQGHYPAIEFTHGICPDCVMRLYPEYYAEYCAEIRKGHDSSALRVAGRGQKDLMARLAKPKFRTRALNRSQGRRKRMKGEYLGGERHPDGQLDTHTEIL